MKLLKAMVIVNLIFGAIAIAGTVCICHKCKNK